MTKDEILQANATIAKFMGYKLVKQNKTIAELPNWDKDYWEGPYDSEVPDVDDCTRVLCYTGDERYHFDWNWLMPVMDKIETIIVDERKLFFSIGRTYCSVWRSGIPTDNFDEYDGTVELASARGCNSKIEAAFKAICKFIDFYQLTNLKNEV